MNWLFDPRLFNWIMLGLASLAAVRWSFHGSWWQALYWASAAAITLAVTGGMQ